VRAGFVLDILVLFFVFENRLAGMSRYQVLDLGSWRLLVGSAQISRIRSVGPGASASASASAGAFLHGFVFIQFEFDFA
jgi:hypothetical protein